MTFSVIQPLSHTDVEGAGPICEVIISVVVCDEQ